MDQLLAYILFEDRFHEFIGEHRNGIEHRFSGRLGGIPHILRDLLLHDILAVIPLEKEGLHPNQIHHAREIRLEPDRQLHHDGVVTELLPQLLGDLGGIRPGTVEFVDECDPGNPITLHLAIDRHRLRLHSRYAAEDEYGAVENAKRPLDLDREIDVTRGIDDVDVIIAPGTMGRRRGDRDPALTLQFHRIHRGSDLILAANFMNRVDPAGIEKHALGQGRLARIDMCADANISEVLDIAVHIPPQFLRRVASGAPLQRVVDLGFRRHSGSWEDRARRTLAIPDSLCDPESQRAGSPIKKKRMPSKPASAHAHRSLAAPD